VTARRNPIALTAILLAVALVCGGAARSDTIADCFSEDNERRITGCTSLLDVPGLSKAEKSLAYAMRALAHSLKGQYDLALPDYDHAIELDPSSAIALNNRAWAYYKTGRTRRGLRDVDKSIQLQPNSAHAHDTRAHIYQLMGNTTKALADYERAVRFGGERIVKLYQCGLATFGLYKGNIDGVYSPATREAMKSCVSKSSCDPLPADEECRLATS
jgi:tetratricopeptide (TPR) repeat protein